MSGRRLCGAAALLCLAASIAMTPGAAVAAPDCSAYSGASLMSWPDTNPAWEFCWRPPGDSAPGPDGSGIEIAEGGGTESDTDERGGDQEH